MSAIGSLAVAFRRVIRTCEPRCVSGTNPPRETGGELFEYYAWLAMRRSATTLGSKLQSWDLRIRESSYAGKWREALSLFQQMKELGIVTPDLTVFPQVLNACLNLSPKHGKSIHASLIKQGYDSFTSIANSVVDFYTKCGKLDEALEAFNCMELRDSVTWNIVVYGHLHLGFAEEGLWWFTKARVAGFSPNTSTLLLLLQSCRSIAAYDEGFQLHAYLVRSGLSSIPPVQNCLLGLYSDVKMQSARRLFDEMPVRDVICWTVMIVGYAQCEEAKLGLQLFKQMVSEGGILPDDIILATALRASAKLEDHWMGILLHAVVINRGYLSDLFVQNSLIDLYSKCNNVDSASVVFEEMPQKNNVSWNSLLSGFVINEQYSKALSLVCLMRQGGVMEDEVTFVSLLQVCKGAVHPSLCKLIHGMLLRRGYELNEYVINTLLDAYAKCNLIDLSLKLFNCLPRRDVHAWSTMIGGLAYCGKPDEATMVFQEMFEAGVQPNFITLINVLEACSVSAELRRSKWAHGVCIRRGLAVDVVIGTAVVDMYSKCGDVDESRKAFEQIPQKNTMTWSALIRAYGMNGQAKEALQLFTGMVSEGLKPNSVTALSVLSACSHGGLVLEGFSFFRSMVRDHGLLPTVEHYSCMIDMLSRAGELDIAMDLINYLHEGEKASASAWGAILSACRSYGSRKVGAGVVSHVLEIEPSNAAGYLLASNMYSAENLWGSATGMRKLVKEKRLKVAAGYSLVHVGDKACQFVAGDSSNPYVAEIKSLLKQIHSWMSFKQREDLGAVEN